MSLKLYTHESDHHNINETEEVGKETEDYKKKKKNAKFIHQNLYLNTQTL